MNKQEAQSLLSECLAGYRKYSFGELQTRLSEIDTCQLFGESGAQYFIEVQVMWDGDRQKNIRVMGAIDDGGWRAFSPLTDSFIMALDGSFVGTHRIAASDTTPPMRFSKSEKLSILSANGFIVGVSKPAPSVAEVGAA